MSELSLVKRGGGIDPTNCTINVTESSDSIAYFYYYKHGETAQSVVSIGSEDTVIRNVDMTRDNYMETSFRHNIVRIIP